MALRLADAVVSRIQRATARNEHVAELVWWTVFAGYAVTVGAVGFGGVVGGVYVYLRYLHSDIGAAVGRELTLVVGLAYVFVLFCALHSLITRLRRWLYGDTTDARWRG